MLRMLTKFCCTSGLFLFLAQTSQLHAQQAIELNDISELIQHVHSNSVESNSEAASETEKKKKEPSERLKLFKELSFDRRPSAILKAWATPYQEEKETEEKANNEEAKENKEKTTSKEEATEKETTKLTPEQIKQQEAAKKQAELAKKQAEEAKQKAEEAKRKTKALQAELKRFQYDVTSGKWSDVESYLKKFSQEEAADAYLHLLQALAQSPRTAFGISLNGNNAQQLQKLMEKNAFSVDDIFDLVSIAPAEFKKEQLTALGGLMKLSLNNGNVFEEFLIRFHKMAKTEKPELKQLEIARILFAANHTVDAGEFLPKLNDAKQQEDKETFDLLSEYYQALYKKDQKPIHLENAWNVTQWTLASAKLKPEEKEQTLQRAVEMVPKIQEAIGDAWLKKSFTESPEQGKEIIAAIGSFTAKNLLTQPGDPEFRIKGLRLQSTAVESLLKLAPERANEWKESLNLLARNWIREAEFSYQYAKSTSLGPELQRDHYGNFFWNQESYYPYSSRGSYGINPIPVGEILETQPSETWMAHLETSILPKLSMLFAQLYLKVSEETKAFPFIEELAKSHPDKAESLVEEFLNVWIKNHNPNKEQGRTNPYMFMYGFEQRASGIPLTRSKQERNLEELTKWVNRLRKLPLKEINEDLLTDAFTNCHSTAEVYRVEAIEDVFGSLKDLKPKTLAALAQKMRGNLNGVWRVPQVQQQAKTNRKKKDIQLEVLRGYEVALNVIEQGITQSPEEWSLYLAKATLLHDKNNFQAELSKSSKFTAQREIAFENFQTAAKLYAKQVPKLAADEQTTNVYELWFYASLGAVDVKHINKDKSADLQQPTLIQQAIQDLQGEPAKHHFEMFANTLFTRLSNVGPGVKFRYLKAGFEIVGDHPQAQEARQVYDYYQDLVTEIKLEVSVDGSDVVGHQEPFGVFVNLKHTREIERESGGFGKYLQNQNNQYFSFNYGRPTENYRDKFQEYVETKLQDHFEILSVTFNSENTHSKALEEYGWRMTPYAYLLLKARGPEVDTLPQIQMDLDFLDTSGYVVLPIESTVTPLDCKPKSPDARPFEEIEITQTLDERQAKEGKLLLEIKAAGRGLMPSLEALLNLKPKEFSVASIEDQGVSISRYDTESDQTAVLSERTWMVALQAKDDLKEHPQQFEFATPKLKTKQASYLRYDDADLVEVEPTIALQQTYGTPNTNWGFITAIIGGVFILGCLGCMVMFRKQPKAKQESRFALPEQLTPFTVLGLLKDIQSNNGLDTSQRDELRNSIHQLEKYYFSDDQQEEPNLKELANSWVKRTTH